MQIDMRKKYQYRTRDGREVLIYSTSDPVDDEFPVRGVYWSYETSTWIPFTWTATGETEIDDDPDTYRHLDLVEVE
jgi:hypothetical protein